jgi:hypothetical protein
MERRTRGQRPSEASAAVLLLLLLLQAWMVMVMSASSGRQVEAVGFGSTCNNANNKWNSKNVSDELKTWIDSVQRVGINKNTSSI